MSKRKPPVAKAKTRAKKAPRVDGDEALRQLRGTIDEIDANIQQLIAARARCAKEIGVLKGLTSTAEFYRPEREAQVLRKVIERNQGPLRNEEMVRLFRELMSACLAQEEALKVAYLGPEGTFTQSAVLKHFGHSVHALSVPTIDEVFHEVEAGTADFGVAPIENSSEGTVNIHTLDMFLTSPLKVCGEIELRIHQHLMGKMHDLRGVRRVCSHPQSLAQCRVWLAEHLPGVELIPVASNAEAARGARGRGCGPGLRLERPVPGGRGSDGQHDALRGRRPQALPGER
jgi:chorismate mutase/prephenate dehydratase